MMASGKYDLVHEYFEKMKKSGNAPKALTYKGTDYPFKCIMISHIIKWENDLEMYKKVSKTFRKDHQSFICSKNTI